MKKTLLFTFLLSFLGGTFLNAQGNDPNATGNPDDKTLRLDEIKSQTEKQLIRILEIVEKRNYAVFANNMVYNGPDSKRNMRAPLLYSDPFEKLTAENNLNRISSWMEKADIYHLSNFNSLPGMTGEFYSWDVEFASRRGKIKNHKFTFLNTSGRFLLSSIE